MEFKAARPLQELLMPEFIALDRHKILSQNPYLNYRNLVHNFKILEEGELSKYTKHKDRSLLPPERLRQLNMMRSLILELEVWQIDPDRNIDGEKPHAYTLPNRKRVEIFMGALLKIRKEIADTYAQRYFGNPNNSYLYRNIPLALGWPEGKEVNKEVEDKAIKAFDSYDFENRYSVRRSLVKEIEENQNILKSSTAAEVRKALIENPAKLNCMLMIKDHAPKLYTDEELSKIDQAVSQNRKLVMVDYEGSALVKSPKQKEKATQQTSTHHGEYSGFSLFKSLKGIWSKGESRPVPQITAIKPKF